MLCRRNLIHKTRLIQQRLSSGWTVNAPDNFYSPKVHALQFVVTPARAIPRMEKARDEWRPPAVVGNLDWRCVNFGLLYYPIWYTCAELRADVRLSKEDMAASADISLFGGLPGSSDAFFSLLNFQSYLPTLGTIPFPPNRRFAKSILNQHGHDILPLPFTLSPFVFDTLDFEAVSLNLDDTIHLEKNPNILFNAAFPVLAPLYIASYEATYNGITYTQQHCLEAFHKDIGGHFYTTMTKGDPTTSQTHSLNTPTPPQVHIDVRFRKDLKPVLKAHLLELLVEAKTNKDIIHGLSGAKKLDMDDIRVRPLREKEINQAQNLIAKLKPLSEFQHARAYSPSKVAYPESIHESLRAKFKSSQPDWWLAYGERKWRKSSSWGPDIEMLKPTKQDEPIIIMDDPSLSRQPPIWNKPSRTNKTRR